MYLRVFSVLVAEDIHEDGDTSQQCPDTSDELLSMPIDNDNGSGGGEGVIVVMWMWV